MFRTEALRQRIELINHLIEFGRQLILIQGGSGLGKTSLLEAIEQAAPPSWIFVRITAGPTLNRSALLDKIAQNLDFEPTEKFSETEVLEEIQRRLQILEKSNQIVVLMVDDAEQLPVESHPLLLELAHREDDAVELRVILAADNSESSLHDHLQASANQQAVIHTVDMPQMDREQTASLLSWWQDQELSDEAIGRGGGGFSSAAIDEIFEQSNGRPGDILILARQHWLSGQNVQLRKDPVKKYIVMGALALTVIALVTFFDKDTEDNEVSDLKIDLPQSPTPPVADEDPKPENIASTTESQTVTKQPSTAVAESLVAEESSVEGETSPSGNLDATITDARGTPDLPLAVDDGLDGMLAATLAENVIADLDSADEDEPAASTETPATPVPDPPQSKAEDPDSTSTAPQQPKVTVKLRSEPVQQDEPKEEIVKVEQAPPEPVLPAKPPPQPVEPASPYSLAGLLRDFSNGYVLQLFGVRSHDAASEYIAKHSLTGNSTVVASMHEGEPWYVVIFGRYNNRDEAQKAANSLTARLPNVKPWPRPVSSLK